MTCSWKWSSGATISVPLDDTSSNGMMTGGRKGQRVQPARSASVAVGRANSMYWKPKPLVSSGQPPEARSSGRNAGQATDGSWNVPVASPSAMPDGARSENVMIGASS